MANKYTRGSTWRKWDLQVQTILDENYIELKDYYTEIKKNDAAKWSEFIGRIGTEKDVLRYDSKSYFYSDSSHNEKTRAKNYVKTFLTYLDIFHSNIGCIAITDHNYDHLYLLDEFIAASELSEVQVICGTEINVQGVHILALFGKPFYGKKSLSESIKIFLSKQDIHNKKTDSTLTVSNKSYTDVIGEIGGNDGVVIYPHCNSENGLFQERGKTDRTHLAAQFNYQKFNILQAKNKTSSDTVTEFINNKDGTLKSGFCFTTASDARALKSILIPDNSGNFTWIKSDPTFEGLKQILYESSLRVKIQASPPEDKPGYQVIDRIEVTNPLIHNSEILLNPNLNSIIGGRSTGKSVLLTAIAKKLKTDRPIKFDNKPDYDKFVQEISDTLKIYWKDGEENYEREVEFFQQGYMYDLARDSKKLSELVQDILKQKGKDQILHSFSAAKAENKKMISGFINDYFNIASEIKEKEKEKRDRGDKKGIEDEISRLQSELTKINGGSISDEEKHSYEQHKKKIETANNKKSAIRNDREKIELLKAISLFRDSIEYELSSVSKATKDKIDLLFGSLKKEIDTKWASGLDVILNDISAAELELDKEILESTDNEDYQKVSKAYNESVQITEVEQKIKIQTQKLFEITAILSQLDTLCKQRDQLVEKILGFHNTYYKQISDIVPKLSDAHDNLNINARVKFETDKYRSLLQSAINQQSTENQRLTNFEYINNDTYVDHVKDIFARLVDEKLLLKTGYTNQSLAFSILTECFYALDYDLEYEGDDFIKMSDGKKAFVVLKLLLDFSDKNCPILIDQPEDSLDNRAIYSDLVQYVRKKKTLRQIIVATHNPNIVVGADSELVIVANQHGIKSVNQDDKKFEYITGSLENTFPRIKEKKEVLLSQGIREHVCEILEGGDIAFKLREKKYALKD